MSGHGRQVLWMLAGIYLIYNGVTLIMGVMRDKPNHYMAMAAAGVVFIGVGAFVIIRTIRDELAAKKAEKEAAERKRETKTAAVTGTETDDESKTTESEE